MRISNFVAHQRSSFWEGGYLWSHILSWGRVPYPLPQKDYLFLWKNYASYWNAVLFRLFFTWEALSLFRKRLKTKRENRPSLHFSFIFLLNCFCCSFPGRKFELVVFLIYRQNVLQTMWYLLHITILVSIELTIADPRSTPSTGPPA